MSEYFSTYHFTEKEQIKKAERIGDHAVEIIDQTYGSGYPAWKRGRNELSYHNGHHGRAVGEGAVKLCVRLGLSPLEQTIAGAAGRAHDIVQLKGRGVDEAKSADWIETELEQANFLDPAQAMARLAILGTEPVFAGGKLVGQKATKLKYPTKTAEQVAKSVASADLGELYVPEGPYLGHQLFREIQGMPAESNIPFEKMVGFQRNQVELLENYTYPLSQANKVLATHKPQVIAYSQDALDKLEKGEIESWDELLTRDEEFIARHR